MIIPIAIIQDPCRLFMAVKLNFATNNQIPIESVRFKGIFRDTLEFGVKDFVHLGDDQDHGNNQHLVSVIWRRGPCRQLTGESLTQIGRSGLFLPR